MFARNWSNLSGEEVENVKSLQTDRRTDRQTIDNRRSEKLKRSVHFFIKLLIFIDFQYFIYILHGMSLIEN